MKMPARAGIFLECEDEGGEELLLGFSLDFGLLGVGLGAGDSLVLGGFSFGLGGLFVGLGVGLHFSLGGGGSSRLGSRSCGRRGGGLGEGGGCEERGGQD